MSTAVSMAFWLALSTTSPNLYLMSPYAVLNGGGGLGSSFSVVPPLSVTVFFFVATVFFFVVVGSKTANQCREGFSKSFYR
jgi:hypothetical protein